MEYIFKNDSCNYYFTRGPVLQAESSPHGQYISLLSSQNMLHENHVKASGYYYTY